MRTGSPLTGSAASTTASEPSIAGMPSASIAHSEATLTPFGKVTSMPSPRAADRRRGGLGCVRTALVTGLLQTEDYARALISVLPHITKETANARLANRMQRQQRVMARDNPPAAWFIVDELSLYREVGNAGSVAAQLRHLLEVAAMPKVTVQVLPAIAHPVNASGFLMADDAVWIEHAAGGFVYTEEELVSGIALRFDGLRAESYRASESLALTPAAGPRTVSSRKEAVIPAPARWRGRGGSMAAVLVCGPGLLPDASLQGQGNPYPWGFRRPPPCARAIIAPPTASGSRSPALRSAAW